MWVVQFDESAEKDLQGVDKPVKARILKFLLTRLANIDDPRSIGSALKGSKLGEFWKYRIGDYRVLAEIQDNVLTIFVVRIGHRRNVYD